MHGTRTGPATAHAVTECRDTPGGCARRGMPGRQLSASSVRSSSTAASRCGVYGNWSNAAALTTRCVAFSTLRSRASVSGQHETYKIRAKRAASARQASSRPERGGSTSSVPKSYCARSSPSSRWNLRVPENAEANSSAERRATRTLDRLFAARLSSQSST